MDVLGELGHGFDKMRCGEVTDPLGWLLAGLCLQLDLKDCVGEELYILLRELLERPVNSDIHPAPVVSSTLTTI